MRVLAKWYNSRAMRLQNQGRLKEAEAWYRRAIDADPNWDAPHYNLGLIFKYAGRWQESLDANREARYRDPEDQSNSWNLGIAATALRDWTTAREAWERCGIQLPAGEGPINAGLGPVAIRLAPGDYGEVVWADRVDPARAKIFSIPLPESGHRFGDIVLHDGAPTGQRYLGEGDATVFVFDALGLWEASPYQTFIVNAPEVTGPTIERLSLLAKEHDARVEDWSTSIRWLCERCSAGLPSKHQEGCSHAEGEHKIALAARGEAEANRIAALWSRQEGLGQISVSTVLS